MVDRADVFVISSFLSPRRKFNVARKVRTSRCGRCQTRARRHRALAADLPAAVPMFEQLVGPSGAPLMSAHGPAHVAGANAGSAGAVTRCVGCHTGHSRLAVAAR